MELALFQAWHVARMTTYGDQRLKPFGEWLKTLKPQERRPQTGAEKIAAMRAVMRTMSGAPPPTEG